MFLSIFFAYIKYIFVSVLLYLLIVIPIIALAWWRGILSLELGNLISVKVFNIVLGYLVLFIVFRKMFRSSYKKLFNDKLYLIGLLIGVGVLIEIIHPKVSCWYGLLLPIWMLYVSRNEIYKNEHKIEN